MVVLSCSILLWTVIRATGKGLCIFFGGVGILDLMFVIVHCQYCQWKDFKLILEPPRG